MVQAAGSTKSGLARETSSTTACDLVTNLSCYTVTPQHLPLPFPPRFPQACLINKQKTSATKPTILHALHSRGKKNGHKAISHKAIRPLFAITRTVLQAFCVTPRFICCVLRLSKTAEVFPPRLSGICATHISVIFIFILHMSPQKYIWLQPGSLFGERCCITLRVW